MKPLLRWARNTLRFYCLWLGSKHEDPSILKCGRPIVVLLCGWGGTRHTMGLIEKRLLQDGFAPISFPLGGLFGHLNTRGVDQAARNLKRHILALATTEENRRVAIIGHSIGGLIGRYLISMEGGNELVHTLITLGSPHRGSPLARPSYFTPLRWISPSIRQIIPGSEFLKKLSTHTPPPEVYCAAFFSRGDHYCPPEYATFDVSEVTDNIVNIDVSDSGHVEYVIDENIYIKILEQLKTGLNRSERSQPRSRASPK